MSEENEQGKTVEARLRIVVDDGDSVEKIKKMRDALRQLREDEKRQLSDQDIERIYASATLKDWRIRNRLERQRDKRAANEEDRVQREINKWLLKEWRDRVQVEKRMLREEEREEQREMRRQQALIAGRQRALRQLPVQALTMMQMGGVAAQAGQIMGMAGLANMAGYSGLASFMSGPMMAFALPALVGVHAAKTAAYANARIHADIKQKQSYFLSHFPLYETSLALRDVPQKAAMAEFDIQKQGIQKNVEYEQFRERYGYMRTVNAYASRGEAFRGYTAMALPTADRRSDAWSRIMYHDQLQLMQVTQASAKAEREMVAARKESMRQAILTTEAEDRFRRAVKEAGANVEFNESLKAGVFDSSEMMAEKLRRTGVTQNVINTLEGYRAQWHESLRHKQAADAASINAAHAYEKAEAARMRTKVQVLEEHQARIEGRAVALGGMGPSGRLRGKLALQILQNVGVDFATPELIATAETVAPQTVRMMKEKAGARMILDEDLRRMAPADFPKSLEQITKEVDAARREAEVKDAEADRRQAENLADVYAESFVEAFMKALQAKVNIEIAKIIAQGQMEAARAVVGRQQEAR